jgi:hypothetical protein
LDYSPTLLIHFKRSHAIIQAGQLRLCIVL